MSSDELSLTWDDHHNTLVKVFGKLLETSTLVDCTIAAEGQYMKAHKIILSACSPYFQLLFNQENEKNPIVVLKDVKFQELKAIIAFIYSGKVRVPEDRLGDFVDAAESLQIKGLGGGNYKTPSSGRISEGSESPYPTKYEFSDSTSPVRRKRRRPININEDNVSEISSGTNVNDEYQSIESVSQDQMLVGRLSHKIGKHSSTASASHRLCSTSETMHGEERIVETDSPASFAESSPPLPPPPPPPLEMLPNAVAMVIKTEPEPIAEVLLPEMDFEPKSEEDAEDTIVLDNEGEVPEAVLNVDTQSSDQYSGMVESHAEGRRPLPPAMTVHPADLTVGDALASVFRGPAAGSVAASVTTTPPVAAEDSSSGTEGTDATFARSGWHHPPPATTTATIHPAARALGDVCVSAFRPAAAASVVIAPHAIAASTSRKAGKELRRRHGCPVCSTAFRARADLVKHLRIHTGDRPFKCNYCGKAFTRKGDVETHRRIHTGERPFRCAECGLTTTNTSNLYQHMRRVHGVEPVEKPRPSKGTSVE